MAQPEQELVETIRNRAITLSYELRELGIVPSSDMSNDVVEISESDILQQAFREASGNMDRVDDAYDSMDGAIDALSEVAKDIDEDKSRPQLTGLRTFGDRDQCGNVDLGSTIPFYSMETNESVPINDNESLSMCQLEQTIASNSELGNFSLLTRGMGKDCSVVNNVYNMQNNVTQLAPDNFCVDPISVTPNVISDCQQQDQEKNPFTVTLHSSHTPNIQRITKPPLVVEEPSPLGSSQNPIQVIQQGSTYHSTQTLTPEQLQQIAHVLKQQHSAKVSENGILYNSATNTRIVYRVVCPPPPPNQTEIDETQAKTKDDKKAGPLNRNRGRPRRNWGKRPEDDIPLGEGPDLSKEEKEEKKKHRPRTRSGRISKPPSYMIKDYKRIHHLDFNEEPYDDSDGGYSDFRQSDEEGGGKRPRTPSLPPGVSTIKARNYKCPTCEKAYIGKGGLSRHFRLHVGHGSMPEGEDIEGLTDENSNGSITSVGSQNQDTKKPEQPEPLGPLSNQQLAYLARRRAKLKELLRPYRDEELLEIVLPRVSQILTLWEFLVMKSEKGEPPQTHLPDLLRHFEELLIHLQKMAKNCLVMSPLNDSAQPSSSGNEENSVYIEITSDNLSQVLGISTGLYEVQQTKLLEEIPPLNQRQHRMALKRAHYRKNNEIANAKRFCMDTLLPAPTTNNLNANSIELIMPDADLGNAEADEDHLDLSELTAEDMNSTMEEVPKPKDHLNLIRLHSNVTNGTLPLNSRANDSAFSNISALGKTDAVLSSVTNNGLVCLNTAAAQNNHLESNLMFSSLSIPIAKTTNSVTLSSDTLSTSNVSGKTGLDIFTGTLDRKREDMMNNLRTKKPPMFSSEANAILSISGSSNPNNPNMSTSLDSYSLIDLNRNFKERDKSNCKFGKTISVSEALGLIGGGKDSNVIINMPSLGDMTLSNSCDEHQTFQNNKLSVREQSNEALLRDMCSGNETVQLVAQDILKVVAENSVAHNEQMREVMGSNFSADCPSNICLVVPDSPILGTLSPGQLELPEVGDALSHPNFLPGNIIVVQNADGTTTLQLRSDQTLPLQSIQTLLGMEHILAPAALD